MVQMSFSLIDIIGGAISVLVGMIGLVLAATSLLLAIASLAEGNKRNIALMKAFGYTRAECARAVFGGFRPFALAGFAAGTLYQYAILRWMVDIFYRGVEGVPDSSFRLPVFFCTLAAFALFYELSVAAFSFAVQKRSVREIASEL